MSVQKTMQIPQVHPHWWHNIIQKVAATKFGSWLLANRLNRLDRPILKLTNNRASMTTWLAGLPVVMLTTTGAKSGKLRTTPLAALSDNGQLVLIASYFGNTHHPAWYLNLKAHPEVTVSSAGQTTHYIASEAEGEERLRLWKRAVEAYPGYQAYEHKAGSRKIPVVVLTPRENKKTA